MTNLASLVALIGICAHYCTTLSPVSAILCTQPCSIDENDTSGNTTCESSNIPAPSPSSHQQSSQQQFSHRTLTLEHILAGDYTAMDPTLPTILTELKNRGAHRCWHKHSTFLDHLLGVHHILRLWEQPATVGRLGLLHSAYSNSYVNLALFDVNDGGERGRMRDIVGEEAERLVYLFCVVDRQSVVVDGLLKGGTVPEEGMDVPHLREEGTLVHLSASTLRMLLVFTMADIADQYFGWQDRLFGGRTSQTQDTPNSNSMLLLGEDDVSQHDSTALWPGISQPGLWMSYVSQLGRVATTFRSDPATTEDTDAALYGGVPPVFDNCTKVLSREDEYRARELYWSVVTDSIADDAVIETLEESIRYNPWTFEPHVMLAQKYLHVDENGRAREEAARALDLQMMWGTAYDKRLSFPAWVAWTRVLHQRASDSLGWPNNSWDVNNFGMVR